MLMALRGKKGQGISGEYVVLIALVSVAITAMTVYLRRTIQGRARDASMLLATRAGDSLGSNVLLEYEPYYTQSVSNADMAMTHEEKASLVPGARDVSVISQKAVSAESQQASALQQQ